MKRLLAYLFLVLVLTFSFQSWTKADDIRDFQIEGISIGDNLLDFYSSEKINKDKRFYPASKKYFYGAFRIESNNYDVIQFAVKNDNSYIVHSIAGKILFDNEFEKCKRKMAEIRKDLEPVLPKSIVKEELPLSKMIKADKSGKSVHTGTTYYFENNDYITIECLDWSNETNFLDNLKVRFSSSIYNEFLLNEAY